MHEASRSGQPTGPHSMPSGLSRVRTTPEFTDATVPGGLLSTHRIAEGVWGRLSVRAGELRFVFEDDVSARHDLWAGDTVDIPPGVPHRVEPGPDARFVVEFYRPD